MIELRRALEELSEAEKEALVETMAAEDFWRTFDEERAAVAAIRARLTAAPPHQAGDLMAALVWREDTITVLNFVESTRVAAHVAFAMVTANVKRARDYLASGVCSYCQWAYRDESLAWDGDVELSEAEIDEVQERIKAAIREHVTVCPVHPMRALERELEERRSNSAGG
jgi:hypothetical protein